MNTPNKPFRVLITEKLADQPESDSNISYLYLPALWQSPQELAQKIRDTDGLIVRNQTCVNAELLSNAQKLQVIGRLGAGLDNIDLQAAQQAGIKVVYAPKANTIAVAEYCLAVIFNILRNIPQAMRSTASGEWLRTQFTGRDLSEASIGLVGFGNIGQALAERIKLLGGKVIVSTRSPEKIPPAYDAVSLNQLLKEVDLVSLHVPGGANTQHLIGSAQFKLMKNTAWLINTARGSVVDEEALYQALQTGEIAGAVSDVREKEPPVPSGLEKLPNFYATPHIAAFTSESQSLVSRSVLADVAAVLKGVKTSGLLKTD